MDSSTRTFHQSTSEPQVFYPFRRLLAVGAMAAGFLASVILLESFLTADQSLAQAARSVTSDPMPWFLAATVWLIGVVLLIVGVLALLVRQLPKDNDR